MKTERTDAERLADAVALWRRSAPGSPWRRHAADEIEELEARLFGSAPHALGELLTEDTEYVRRRNQLAHGAQGD